MKTDIKTRPERILVIIFLNLDSSFATCVRLIFVTDGDDENKLSELEHESVLDLGVSFVSSAVGGASDRRWRKVVEEGIPFSFVVDDDD